ncbi:tannase and feruloyl esterase [Hypomontagnella monticulosa]|nr:tannase and feruloyl esterase [Hypomontagnella monticulosa]
MALNSLISACVPSTFNPVILGADVLSVSASIVSNYNLEVPGDYRFTAPSVKLENATFCNVTVTYKRYKDEIHAEAWLPVENWNERFEAFGGGGWIAGRWLFSQYGMSGALHDGFATITTDAGLGTASDASSWALDTLGNVDFNRLLTFSSIALNDEAEIGKSMIKSFYGKPPAYSYFTGCSQGGRQGFMLAQRYPKAFDGISANAPGIQWSDIFFNMAWAESYMRMKSVFPHGCELDAITAAAVSKCDELDGVSDGIIANVDDCKKAFDPFEVVGKTINCSDTGKTMKISKGASEIVNATWGGIFSATTGERLFPGLDPGADLTCNTLGENGLSCVATTDCSSGSCVPVSNGFGATWIRLFLERDPNFNMNMSQEQFESRLHASKQQYGSIIGTEDPDLSEFKAAGGRIITYHGLADNLLPPEGMDRYFRKVSKAVDGIDDFFRYYKIPGLAHCFGGSNMQPTSLFQQLQAWVENGTAPEDSPVSFVDPKGVTQNRIICPFPKEARFHSDCGDAAKAECWACENRSPSPVAQEPESYEASIGLTELF